LFYADVITGKTAKNYYSKTVQFYTTFLDLDLLVSYTPFTQESIHKAYMKHR